MDDLQLNFDTTPTIQKSSSSRRKEVKGKWTTKVRKTEKQKRKLEAVSSVPAGTNKPVLIEEPTFEAFERPTKRQKVVPHSNQSSQEAASRPHTHSQSQQQQASQSQPQKKQYISSLFSSLPQIQHSQDRTTLQTDAKPSNAPSDESFASLGISPLLERAIKSEKIKLERPTNIQRLAIPHLTSYKTNDAILQAQTGSGKTMAYLLPIISNLLLLSQQAEQHGMPFDRTIGTLALVLVPTRELAQQVYQVAVDLIANIRPTPEETPVRWLVPGLLSGGTTRNHEKARLRKGVPLLIATPGRLIDHLETTTSFRLGGEYLKQAVQRRTKAAQDAEEFEIEDAPFVGDANDSSDEDDFMSRPTSSSYRDRPLRKDLNKAPEPEGPPANDLGLRWLVLDEADRLMDMGFEPQITKIVNLIDKRVPASLRRSVLCSATMPSKVQKLAGSLLNEPETVQDDGQHEVTASTIRHAPPSQLSQSYIVVPEKLRLVTLVALLRKELKGPSVPSTGAKAIVFMSTTDSVDFHWTSLGGMKMTHDAESVATTSKAELAAICPVLPQVSLFRLHGNLDLLTRLATLKAFVQCSQGAVLFCTSVAARGLDIPLVKTVVQFDLPTEGGAAEYIHRVGRTARAGHKGDAWAFLLPSETGWVRWVEAQMQEKASEKEDETLPVNTLREVPVESVLKDGFGGKANEYEHRSTDVQMAFERWVEADDKNAELSKSAFTSHIRAYATHPSSEKSMFHVKNIHLGHLAKAFGLREAPKGLGAFVGQARAATSRSEAKSKSKKATTVAAPAGGDSSDEEKGDTPRGKKMPRSGRALEGKRLKAAKSDASEFNIASL